jgi:hypothetical protein
MKLYKVKTKGDRRFLVISNSFENASNRVKKMLEAGDYDYYKLREVESIEVLAEEISEFPAGKPHFIEDGKNLIIDFDGRYRF